MELSNEVKQKIIDILDSKEFRSNLYEGLDDEKREELGQFYTPGNICIQMIEKFTWDSLEGKTILDPTCGSGNLLIACLIAGADSDKLYGNEYDPIAVKLCRKRLNRACDILGKPHIQDWQIHQGNALQTRCITEFDQTYLNNYNPKGIDDLNYAQGKDKNGNTLSWAKENADLKRRLYKPVQLTLF
jgi:23S rRNA G2445 N2-methylase RlmL